jgi:hypothetical protein
MSLASLGVKIKITATDVIDRLEQASTTLAMLPAGARPQTLRVQTYGYVPEIEGQAPATRTGRCVVPAREIGAMEEAYDWLRLIANATTRRIVGMRSLLKGPNRPALHSWAKIAEKVGADVRSVKTWHAAGIRTITAALNA